jgi:putative heme iron utilization protein
MVSQTGRLPPLSRSAIDKPSNAAFLSQMTDNLPHSARDLIRRLDRASLATLLPGPEGAGPYASLVLVGLAHDLSPLLLLSDLAEHSRAIASDSRVSLLFDGTVGLEQPLTGPRVTVLGRASKTEDEGLKRRFLARHPDAEMYAGFADFNFYRVDVERAHIVAGFGKIAWLAAGDLALPALGGLAESEEGILEHMNSDHADTLQLFAGKLLGRAGQDWRMTGIDRDGIDLRQGGAVARLGFDPPLAALEEVRPRLIALAKQARESA